MPRKITLKGLKKRADQVFSAWVRARGSIKGANTCVTCGVVKPISELHAGHFWKRSHLSTRFEPTNVHCQCPRCNLYRGGAEAEHAAYILKTHGREEFDRLEELHSKVVKFSRSDYEEIIKRFQNELG